MVKDAAPLQVPPLEGRLAGRMEAAPAPVPAPARAWSVRVLRELAAVDLAVYRAVAETPTPVLDRPVRALSRAADRWRLWLAIGGAMAISGGRTGRRAASAGLVALVLDSAVVELGMKAAARRRRPDRDSAGVPDARRVPMPRSGSFPSGHASRGFAFAGAVAQTLPAAAAPLRLLAGAVGYSRVHTGVHYPGDVILGALVGAAVGRAVGWGMSRRADRLPVRTPAGGAPR